MRLLLGAALGACAATSGKMNVPGRAPIEYRYVRADPAGYPQHGRRLTLEGVASMDGCQCGCGRQTNIIRKTTRGQYRGDRYRYARGHHAAPKAFEERFWSRVDKSAGPDGCWEWTGTLAHGYGSIRRADRSQVKAHRLSWEMANGRTIPDGLYACHHCDNRSCVNPAHLFVGTPADNGGDAARKGRIVHAKLTPETVRLVRLAAAEGTPKMELARRYGMTPAAIRRVINRKTYAHVA